MASLCANRLISFANYTLEIVLAGVLTPPDVPKPNPSQCSQCGL